MPRTALYWVADELCTIGSLISRDLNYILRDDGTNSEPLGDDSNGLVDAGSPHMPCIVCRPGMDDPTPTLLWKEWSDDIITLDDLLCRNGDFINHIQLHWECDEEKDEVEYRFSWAELDPAMDENVYKELELFFLSLELVGELYGYDSDVEEWRL